MENIEISLLVIYCILPSLAMFLMKGELSEALFWLLVLDWFFNICIMGWKKIKRNKYKSRFTYKTSHHETTHHKMAHHTMSHHEMTQSQKDPITEHPITKGPITKWPTSWNDPDHEMTQIKKIICLTSKHTNKIWAISWWAVSWPGSFGDGSFRALGC
jgi:hypothetical protein